MNICAAKRWRLGFGFKKRNQTALHHMPGKLYLCLKFPYFPSVQEQVLTCIFEYEWKNFLPPASKIGLGRIICISELETREAPLFSTSTSHTHWPIEHQLPSKENQHSLHTQGVRNLCSSSSKTYLSFGFSKLPKKVAASGYLIQHKRNRSDIRNSQTDDPAHTQHPKIKMKRYLLSA